jgi:hypothetical protein
MSILRKIDLV